MALQQGDGNTDRLGSMVGCCNLKPVFIAPGFCSLIVYLLILYLLIDPQGASQGEH
jgi:hypothetical protein